MSSDKDCASIVTGSKASAGLIIAGILVIGIPILIVAIVLVMPTWIGFIFVGLWLYGGCVVTLVIGIPLIIAGIVLKVRARSCIAGQFTRG